MAPKKRKAPSSGDNKILRYLKKGKENAGANREELGEEGVTGGGAAGGGVAGGGAAGGGVAGGGAAGGGAAGGGAAGGGAAGGGVADEGVADEGVAGGGAAGGGAAGEGVAGGGVAGGGAAGEGVAGGGVGGEGVAGGGVTGEGVAGGGVAGGGAAGEGVAGGGAAGGGAAGGGAAGGGAAGGGAAGEGVAGGGVAGGGVAGGGAAGGGAAGGGSEAPPCVEQAPPCVKQEKAEELHEHTISWQYEKHKYTWSCKKYGIYESLQESDKFREIEQNAPEKELVILITPKKAISSHFPCQHIPTKNLTVKYIKAQDNKTKTTTESIKNPGKIIIFSVKTAGSKNIINVVMKNHELKNTVDEVLVYAYKGQTVREALEQDGRFSDEILQSNYLLEDTEDGKRTEMSSMVHILNDKCFTVLRSSKKAKQKDETPQEATSSRTESSKSNQPTPNVSNQPTPNMSNQPPTYQPIPGSEDLLELLRSQFKELVKRMKERQNLSPKAVQQLFSQEYGKNSKLCHEVRTMRKFLELSNSVCQVRIDGWAVGTGFLLFGKYILTNAHVVLDQAKRRENITVIFSYEELSDSQAMGVTVVAHDFRRDTARHKHDWALLEVCGDLNTQSENAQPLLKHLGLVTERGQICIIGHPEGKVKMIDPCYTIPCNERKEKMEISVTSHYLFPDPMDRDIQTYESCFYDGASGSPVFDHSFKVVSMHSGGFNDEQTKERVLEYSHPLSLIMEQIIIQIVRKRKVLVLWAMITCGIPPVVIAGLRGKVEPTEFVWTADEMKNLTESVGGELSKVKEFFKFFENSETDEPMDVS